MSCDLDWSWVRGYPESMFLILEPDLFWDEIDVVSLRDSLDDILVDVKYQ